VLDGVSLTVETGEVVAIIGRSGSGKSTLLRCINGLERPDSGAIEFAGREFAAGAPGLKALRREIGIVFQSYNLFPHLSVERNITLGPTAGKGLSHAAAKARARTVLQMVGLEDKIAAYPGQLSGGQQQRVAIARALAMEPRLVLFDEITAALDAELIGEVVRVLETLAADGMTMVLVTHEMGFARRSADTVVFMHQGRIWEQGPPSVLFNAPQTPELASFIDAVLSVDPARQRARRLSPGWLRRRRDWSVRRRRHRPAGPSRLSGRMTVAVVPRPSVLSRRRVPPCSSAIALTRARPSPVPSWRRLNELSAWTKGCRTRSSCSAGMPMPVSLTAKRSPVSSTETTHSMRPPIGVNLQEFGQEVEQHLLHQALVGGDRQIARRQLDGERQAGLGDARPHQAAGGLDDLAGADQPLEQLELAGCRLRLDRARR